MPRGEHRPSALLSREENETVFSMIGPKCQALATGVVQLFTTEGPAHAEWRKRDTGVLCLVKDNGKRSYFFRLYCPQRRALLWEHEVYLQIEYKSPRAFLHTFEAEEYMTAFNFASENEAKLLRTILIEKIELRKVKREEKRQRALSHTARVNGAAPAPASSPAPAPAAPAAPAPAAPPPPPKSAAGGGGFPSKSSKKSKGRRLTKADIGMPLASSFKHVSHVGWDQDRGFDVEKLPDEQLKSFFSKAGVSETQLQDADTRNFIYGFIDSHGGLDAVKRELGAPAPPAAPAPAAARPSRAPPVPARGAAPPPAPPARAPPPPPARAPPPPAAPPPRPPQPSPPAPACAPPPPPPPGAPPPPPPPAPPAPPPAPPGAPLAPAADDARAALMESIRRGPKGLRPVEAGAGGGAPEDSRSNLLSEIRQGVELKAVGAARAGAGAGVGAGAGAGAGAGLAGLLARALDDRNRAIHPESEEDSDSDTNDDDDWD